LPNEPAQFQPDKHSTCSLEGALHVELTARLRIGRSRMLTGSFPFPSTSDRVRRVRSGLLGDWLAVRAAAYKLQSLTLFPPPGLRPTNYKA
jgi:hypothetical protein